MFFKKKEKPKENLEEKVFECKFKEGDVVAYNEGIQFYFLKMDSKDNFYSYCKRVIPIREKDTGEEERNKARLDYQNLSLVKRKNE